MVVFLLGVLMSCTTYQTVEGVYNEQEFLEDFLSTDFTLLNAENVSQKVKRTLVAKHGLDVGDLTLDNKSYNTTDCGEPGKHLLKLGCNKMIYFVLYDKGGRVPVRILSIGYLNKRRDSFVDLILRNKEVSEISRIKELLKQGAYTNRWQGKLHTQD